MAKLLNKAINIYQATGAVPAALVMKIKEYDRRHPMWACMASDEDREAWEIVNAA